MAKRLTTTPKQSGDVVVHVEQASEIACKLCSEHRIGRAPNSRFWEELLFRGLPKDCVEVCLIGESLVEHLRNSRYEKTVAAGGEARGGYRIVDIRRCCLTLEQIENKS